MGSPVSVFRIFPDCSYVLRLRIFLILKGGSTCFSSLCFPLCKACFCMGYSFLSVTLSVKSFHALPLSKVKTTMPAMADRKSKNPTTSICSPPETKRFPASSSMFWLHYSTNLPAVTIFSSLASFLQIFFSRRLLLFTVAPFSDKCGSSGG